MRHLEPGMLVDPPRDLAGQGQEFLHAAAVQDEYREFVSLGTGWAAARGGHLAEFQGVDTLGDRLDIVRIVVLSVDEDDLLGAPGDDQFTRIDQAEVAGSQPAVRGEGARVDVRRLEVAFRHVLAPDLHVADVHLGQGPVGVVHDPQFAIGNGTTFAHQLERAGLAADGRAGLAANAERLPVEQQHAILAPDVREADRKRGLRQAVDREHRRTAEARACHPREEFLAQRHVDRFGAVEYQPHRAQVDTLRAPLPKHFQVVAEAEVRRGKDGGAFAGRCRRPEQWPPDVRVRRHQVDLRLVGEKHDEHADQTHVVGQGHPGETNVLLAQAGRFGGTTGIGEDVAVGEHHTLRLAGGAGGELDERDVVRADCRGLSGRADLLELVDQEDPGLELRECGGLVHAASEVPQAVQGLLVGVEKG